MKPGPGASLLRTVRSIHLTDSGQLLALLKKAIDAALLLEQKRRHDRRARPAAAEAGERLEQPRGKRGSAGGGRGGPAARPKTKQRRTCRPKRHEGAVDDEQGGKARPA